MVSQVAGDQEKQGNEHGAATTYHQLGIIAADQRDFAQAEQWYRKSLAIAEKQGNEHGAATTYHQLGIIAAEQRDFAQAGQWYLTAIAGLTNADDTHSLKIAAGSYWRLYQVAPAAERDQLRAMWEDASIDAVEPPPWDEAPPPESDEDG